MKKKLLIVYILTLFLINIMKIDAASVSSDGVGNSGGVSGKCAGGQNCANTIGLKITNNNVGNIKNNKHTYTFDDTAVYGVRITVVDKNNNQIKKPINFWATDSMNNAIGYNGGVVKRVTIYNNKVDPNYNKNGRISLWNYSSGGLRKIDNSGATYSGYIGSLSVDEITNFLSEFGLNIKTATDNDYYLKMEPIFAFHYQHGLEGYKPNHAYFVGTVSEILRMITTKTATQKKIDKKMYTVTTYGINYWTLGMLSCGPDIINSNLSEKNAKCDNYGYEGVPIILQSKKNGYSAGFNVLKNYITTVYLSKRPNGTKFPVFTEKIQNYDTLNLYRIVLGKKGHSGGKGLSVGYVKVSDFSDKSYKITITKVNKDGECYDGAAYFQLRGADNNHIGPLVGYNNWCDNGKNKRTITISTNDENFKNLKSKFIINNTYLLYEYSQNDDKKEYQVENAQFSVDGGLYKKSTYLTFKLNKTEKSITVKNESTEDSCDSSLKEIKNICNGSNNTCTGTAATQAISRLFLLYQQYDDYNKLLNYNITSSGVSIKNTSCSHVDCSSSAADLLACQSGTINGSTPNQSGVNRRVCYVSNDDSAHESSGSYYNDDIDAYCSITYDYKFPKFSKSTVKSGNLLWDNLPFKNKVGEITIKVNCENGYRDVNETTLKNKKLTKNSFGNEVSDILPSIDMDWDTGGTVYDELLDTTDLSITDLNYNNSTDPDKNKNTINPVVNCTNSNGHNYCYAQWGGTYKFNVNYHTNWYSNNLTGEFFSEDSILDKYGTTGDYVYRGSGLPISIDNPTQNDLISYIYIHTDETYTAECLYNVKNDIEWNDCPDGDCDDPDGLTKKFNFDFRVIDTSNPFPGAGAIDNVSGRLAGSNWCSASNIGKKLYDYSKGEYYIVGDINGDGKVDSSDTINNTTKTVSADIDGDGEVTYQPGNCLADHKNLSDRCILDRYVRADEKGCYGNSLYNSIVRDNISNAKNSYSTDEPMYSFTLTSQDIKNIRDYNKLNAYDDYNMKCLSDDKECLSTFLTDWIKKKKVNGKSLSKSAQASVNNSSCYETRVAGNWCGNS